MRIVVLHNDVSTDISPSDLDVLNQRDAVIAALRHLGHEAEAWSCTLDLSGTKSVWKPSGRMWCSTWWSLWAAPIA